MIKFGTDGWRGIIAKDFTFENVAKAATGVAKACKIKHPDRKNIYIGFDRRFLSEDFAKMIASIFAFEGFQVFLTNTYTPTPVLSFKAKQDPKAVGSVVITASHNPPNYNGFKFKEFHGCSALKDTTDEFEKFIAVVKEVSIPCDQVFDGYVEKRKIIRVNLMDDYKRTILNYVDTQKIKDANFTVAIDAMYGSGSGYFKEILESLHIKVIELRGEENPGFCGIAPEPVEKNLTTLFKEVTSQGLSCGFATDGDGDRLGACDENGQSFTTQMILSCFYWHMLQNKKKKWNIARSVSTTKMVDLIAQKFGQECIETPVGFKFIAQCMVEGRAQIGGEESGGVGIIDYIPERDGIFTALVLLEMMAVEGKSLSELYSYVCNQIRPYQFLRLDLHLTQEEMRHAMDRLQHKPPKKWDQRDIEWVQTMDGFKFYMKDGSWILIRPSGTEPIFRLYAEAESIKACTSLLKDVQAFIHK
ncbi:MAG: phosphoglucomutase/phosphomannomutase family protein [Bdellovibrionales bacterium]|nr:phosphoglucomutase/phosphomannomutase family protein [Bdellovibrionales bacterium]